MLSTVIIIILVIAAYSWNKRIKDLEKRILELERSQDRAQGLESPKLKAEPAPRKDAGPWQSKKTDGPPKSVQPAPAKVSAQVTEPPRREKRPKPPRKAFVFTGENLDALVSWLQKNWFLAVAAVSLALAGIFLVQYGVENGYLSPRLRVILAAAFGVALILAGEYLRRRWGDDQGVHTAYLPSTFAGAGLITLFATVLAALQLYALIGITTALVLLVCISAIAIVLGWFYGPLLAIAGLVGGCAAPFVVGGESDTPQVFFYYFAIIALTALFIDTVKRWAWVSTFGLILTAASSAYIFLLGAGDAEFLFFATVVFYGAVTIPVRSLRPAHDGPITLAFLNIRDKQPILPDFPTRLAAGATLGATGAALLVAFKDAGSAEVWLAVILLCGLFVALVTWLRKAEALSDLVLAPVVALLYVVVRQATYTGTIYQTFRDGIARLPEDAAPVAVSMIVAIGLVISALSFWRALWPGGIGLFWAAGAAIAGPLFVVLLEFFWLPAEVLGAGPWAVHVMVMAAVMVFFTERIARQDKGERRRSAYFALAAATMIALALFIMLSDVALSLALAAMVLAVAYADRALNMPGVLVFVTLAALAVTWRLVIYPGLDWTFDAPYRAVALGFIGSAALMGGGWMILATRQRERTRVMVESTIWLLLTVYALATLHRIIGDLDETFGASLVGSIALTAMLVQLYRLRLGGVLKWVRIFLAILFGGLAFFAHALTLTILSPLSGYGGDVVGPPVFDSLMVAYVVPALILGVGLWKMPNMRKVLRVVFMVFVGIFAAFYLAMEIRRMWHGNDLSAPLILSGEQNSYTIAMLVASVIGLYVAFSRRSHGLRKLATLGVGVTIAKVFLIDMAELAGLWRVASFLGLGLALAGLAWLSRLMMREWEAAEDEAADES